MLMSVVSELMFFCEGTDLFRPMEVHGAEQIGQESGGEWMVQAQAGSSGKGPLFGQIELDSL